MSNITKHKLSCCGRPYKYEWYNNRNLESCPYCDCDKPILEEIDKEEQVLMISGFSGDKRHEERPWGSFTIILDEPNVKIKKIIVELHKASRTHKGQAERIEKILKVIQNADKKNG